MRRAKGRGKRTDMGMLVAETATRLRSGATPEGAWRQTLERAGLGCLLITSTHSSTAY